jgi:hypothetical protein
MGKSPEAHEDALFAAEVQQVEEWFKVRRPPFKLQILMSLAAVGSLQGPGPTVHGRAGRQQARHPVPGLPVQCPGQETVQPPF